MARYYDDEPDGWDPFSYDFEVTQDGRIVQRRQPWSKNVNQAEESTVSRASIEFAIATLERDTARRVEELHQQLAKLEQYGSDLEDGAVIRWDMQFSGYGTVYSYAAIRTNGRWFTTGPKSPKSYSWVQLTDWLAENRVVDGTFRVLTRG